MDELTEKIKARIAELEKSLDALEQNAAAHRVAIGELKHLLEPTKNEEPKQGFGVAAPDNGV